MAFSWIIPLVFLSVLIAIIGAFTTLNYAARMREADGRGARLWMLLASATLGMSIWSMHFIGMLAMHLPIRLGYDRQLTALSILPAFAAALLGLQTLCCKTSVSNRSLWASGLLMGLGISVMHYIGMAALNMSPPIHYDPGIVLLSVVIAVIVSWAALLLMLKGDSIKLPQPLILLLSAVIMGLAVSGMHYSAMFGAHFHADSVSLADGVRLGLNSLAILMASPVLLMFGLGLLVNLFDQRMARQNAVELAGIVLVCALTVTYLLWDAAQQNALQVMQARFDTHVKNIVDNIDKRMKVYEQIMRGVNGLFSSSGIVSRDEYHTYISGLHLEENYPGIQGVRYMPIVTEAEKNRHVAAMRKANLPAYRIWPEGRRNLYAPVTYVEPLNADNQQILGYDMYSDQDYPLPGEFAPGIRHNAMEQARDSAKTTLSGDIKLMFEHNQHGFVMFLPIYKPGAPQNSLTGRATTGSPHPSPLKEALVIPTSSAAFPEGEGDKVAATLIAERRANIMGWVCSVFRTEVLMDTILKESMENISVEIHLYDGEVLAEARQIYDSRPDQREHYSAARFQRIEHVDIAGHRWTLLAYSEPAFEAQMENRNAKTIATSGITISLMLALFTWLLMYNRARTLQAAASLRESESKHRLLLESAAEAIYGIDTHGNCTFCNSSCLQMLGYQHPDDLIGKNMHDLIHYRYPDETFFPVAECRIYKAFQAGVKTHVDDEVFWRADGSCFPVEYWSYPQVQNDVVVGAIVTFIDLSERVQANEKLVKLSKAVENSPVSVIITDVHGTIEYVNQAFSEASGYSSEELLGHNPRMLKSGMQSQEFYEALWKTILAGEVWQGELFNKRKNGEVYVEHVSISPIRNNQGHITHFVGVKEDITEYKRIDHELRNSMAAAEAANIAKSEFLANMSHEIRTPMNAIIGLTHLCLQTAMTPQQQDYLQKVNTAAQALLNIINDILDLSKIEAGKMELEQISFDLDEVTSNLTTLFAEQAEAKGLELLLEITLDVPQHLIGDPLRLGQVLINLVNNAIKFTERGEVLVQAELAEENDNEVVLRFTVQDTGIGLSQKQIDKLFQDFSQADASTTRKYGGTGLGLVICKKIVDIMGGRIWVESAIGHGSKFMFTARFDKPVMTVGRSFIPITDLHGLRVLAVDDNVKSRRILHNYLESFTFQVDEAADGIETVTAVIQAYQQKRPYDLVILDWQMPRMDGIAAAEKIRHLTELNSQPKLLLISAAGSAEMRRHQANALFDGWITKPFGQSGLFDAIMEVYGCLERKSRVHRSSVQDKENIAKISGAHLLLVEDNDINQQVAQEMLARIGVTVTIAENGKLALQKVMEQAFDGILMDMQMPVMDGISATQAIRKLPQFKDLPIIAMTANAMSGDHERCLQAGMNDHISKPINPHKMLATLAQWIVPFSPRPLGEGAGVRADAVDLSSNQLQTANRSLSGVEANTGFDFAQPASGYAQPASNSAPAGEQLKLPTKLDGVDLEDGLMKMSGNSFLYRSLLERFLRNNRDTAAKLHEALQANDRETARRLVHTIKGVAGNLAAGDLSAAADQLEQAILQQQEQAALPAFERELSRLLIALQALEQTEATQATLTTKEPDIAAITPLLQEISSLLEQDYPQAVQRFDRLKPLLEHTRLALSMTQLSKALSDFDTDVAQQILQKMAEDLEEKRVVAC